LKEFRVALELGLLPDAWDRWNFFHAALAAGDRSFAHYLSSLDPEPPGEALDWLVAQVNVAQALFRGEDRDTPGLLEVLRTLVLETSLPSGVQEEIPEIQNVYRLLDALFRKDAADFNRLLAERMRVRADSFHRSGANAPIGLMDLVGLGLCRLARQQGIGVTVNHVLLPFEIPALL
jgi:hypothetical protein